MLSLNEGQGQGHQKIPRPGTLSTYKHVGSRSPGLQIKNKKYILMGLFSEN